uniref:C2 domain-containing protein n=1 Tax=Populus trichocarpa TaxID=3694 RepID=A9P985_POPTR|nr:unknown [Populus trichocarpa]
MTILVVEVHDACDLMPKDGHGSASPYVEVDFDEQNRGPKPSLRSLTLFGMKSLFSV